jgi:hypothetical protein
LQHLTVVHTYMSSWAGLCPLQELLKIGEIAT